MLAAHRFVDAQFQSTLPARGATWMVLWMLFTLQFQSTLPARGATFQWRGCSAA